MTELQWMVILTILLVLIGFAWRLKQAREQDRLIARARQQPVEDMPSLIFLGGEEEALYKRFKTLLMEDRFMSKDATNEAKMQFLWAILDIIEPEHWRMFELYPTDKREVSHD